MTRSRHDVYRVKMRLLALWIAKRVKSLTEQELCLLTCQRTGHQNQSYIFKMSYALDRKYAHLSLKQRLHVDSRAVY